MLPRSRELKLIEGLKRGCRRKKRKNETKSATASAISGYSISDGRIEHPNSVLSQEMLRMEIIRLLNFEKDLGIDLAGIEKEVVEKLQILEIRDD